MTRFAFALVLFATGITSAADDLPRREKGDLAIKARAILHKYCGECHGANPAPSALSLLNHGQLLGSAPPVPWVNLADAPRSQLLEFLEDGSMPPGGRPRPTLDEIDTLKKWVRHKAPSYPRAFDDRTTLALMLDDLDRQPEENRARLRYLSFAHLVRDDAPLPDLKALESRLQRALLASSGRAVSPQPVDDTGTLFRLDLRPLEWDAPDLFERIENQKSVGVYPLVAFDLILNEYPASLYEIKVGDLEGRLRSFLAAAKQLRPVPFLRADWFAEALAPAAPLAADMKSLVNLAESLEKKSPTPCGPVPKPLLGAKAAEIEEPVASPTLTSWFGGSTAPMADPFGLKAAIVLPLKANAIAADVEVDEAFRIRVEGKREFRFLLLNILAAGDIRIQAVGGGNVVKPGESRLLGPDKGLTFKSGSILTGGDTEVEHYVLIAAEAVVPPPTIVRSVHADTLECRRKNQQPVWRFLYDKPPAEFDPSKAARVVLPLTIHKKP